MSNKKRSSQLRKLAHIQSEIEYLEEYYQIILYYPHAEFSIHLTNSEKNNEVNLNLQRDNMQEIYKEIIRIKKEEYDTLEKSLWYS